MVTPLSPVVVDLALASEHGAEQRSFYSVSEVAALLGVSRVSIWRWISAGRLPVSRLGHRTVRIRREDVERIVRPLRASPPRQPAATEASSLLLAGQTGLHGHFVMFYDAESFLVESVADFVAPTLRAGDRAVVIATPEHSRAIEARLKSLGVDPADARNQGRYVARDAIRTLSRIMLRDAPDPARFRQVVRKLTGQGRDNRGLRVFGEMVALLVAQGKAEAALALEALWNREQEQYRFSLLCAYPMQQFGGDAFGPVLDDACAQHSSVIPAETYSGLTTLEERHREVAALQQKAASLEMEVAARRTAEQQLQQALAAERAARDHAEAALRVRDEFLSIASHELRTPISVVGAQAQLMLRRLDRVGELEMDRVISAMRTVGSQANKLSRLVGQLLDVTRLDTGKLQLDIRETDVTELVMHVVAAARLLTDLHTISVVAPDSLISDVDPLRVEQVLTNLLDNAVKYSPRGGSVEVVLSEPTNAVFELSVRDHGLGIPPERRTHIFERFYQAHPESAARGMGLGLFVSKEIVELHGGAISAEFPQDGGTRFVVQLPLQPTSVLAAVAD